MYKWKIEIFPKGVMIDGNITYIHAVTTSDESLMSNIYVRSWRKDNITSAFNLDSLMIIVEAATRDEAIAKGIAIVLEDEE